jgi:hypothetical protein
VFYFGQRQWIFDVPLEDDLNEMISLTVEHFMAGAQTVIPRLIEAAQSKKT